MDTPSDYIIKHEIPTVAVRNNLRTLTGLTPNMPDTTQIGLRNSLFAVQIFHNDDPIGMGRVVGDGACFFQILDIAVLPEHQGKGLGKMIMREIKNWLDKNVPKSAYVGLIADGKAKDLYMQFGFEPVEPASIGMAMWM